MASNPHTASQLGNITPANARPNGHQIMLGQRSIAANHLIGTDIINPGLIKTWIQYRCMYSNVAILDTACRNLRDCSNVSDPTLRLAHMFNFEHSLDIVLVTYCHMDAAFHELDESSRRLKYAVTNNAMGANDPTFTTNLRFIFENSIRVYHKVQALMAGARACVDYVYLKEDSLTPRWDPKQTDSLRTASPGDILSLEGLAANKRKELFEEARQLCKGLQDCATEEEAHRRWKLMQLSKRVREGLIESKKIQVKRWWEIEHPGEQYVEL
ncbi:hypothetical protein N7G274_003411 [Stereocaulon virgatum]|uniref:Uncharacterized protein n=1 Tax=Stereocaulon virgatum TaxID=373712 RepID=A0ABR4AGD7_9LECA